MAQITKAAIRYRIRALESTLRSMDQELRHPEPGGNRVADKIAVRAKRQELSVLNSQLEAVKASPIKPKQEHYYGQQNEGSHAQIGDDGKPIEVHHREDGELEEMTQTDHRLGDNFLKNHPGGKGAEPVDRKEFERLKRIQNRDPWHNDRYK